MAVSDELLQEALTSELAEWTKRPFEELCKLGFEPPIVYQKNVSGEKLDFDVLVLEKTDNCIHFRIAVNEYGGYRAYFPLSRSVIVYRDRHIDFGMK